MCGNVTVDYWASRGDWSQRRVSYHSEVLSPRNSERSVPPRYQQSSDPWCWQAVQQSAEPCSIKSNPLRQWLTGHQTNLPSWWQIPHSEKGEQERSTAYDQPYRERKRSEGNAILEPATRGSLVSIEMTPPAALVARCSNPIRQTAKNEGKINDACFLQPDGHSLLSLWLSLPALCTYTSVWQKATYRIVYFSVTYNQFHILRV